MLKIWNLLKRKFEALKTDRLVATITNIYYGFSSWEILEFDPSLWVVAIFPILLMFGSGIHHYFLKDSTQKLDYFGMYGVIFMLLALALGFAGIYGGIASLILAVSATALFGASRALIAGGVLALLVMVTVMTSVANMMTLSVLMAWAFVWNYMGDNIHNKFHSIIHGLGWHIPSAKAISLATKWLA